MDGTVLNIAACPLDYTRSMVPAGAQSSWTSWVVKVPQQEMLDLFGNFGRDARTILEQVKEPTRWSMCGLYPPLESYVGVAKVDGRDDDEGPSGSPVNAALVGDAAHAMLPFLGAGAGAGIEDAYVLARLLSHPQTQRSNISVCPFTCGIDQREADLSCDLTVCPPRIRLDPCSPCRLHRKWKQEGGRGYSRSWPEWSR